MDIRQGLLGYLNYLAAQGHPSCALSTLPARDLLHPGRNTSQGRVCAPRSFLWGEAAVHSYVSTLCLGYSSLSCDSMYLTTSPELRMLPGLCATDAMYCEVK